MRQRTAFGWRIRTPLRPRAARRLSPRRTIRRPFITILRASPSLRATIFVPAFMESISIPASILLGAANSGNTYHSSDNLAAVPQLFYTYTPKDFPLSFGLGVYAPYGGSMKLAGRHRLPHGRHARQADLFDAQSRRGGEAVAQFVLWRRFDGELCEHGFGTGSSPVLPATRHANFFRFKGDGWSVGYNLGLRWQPIDQISIGATFRSTATVTLNGHTEFEQFPAGSDRHLPARAHGFQVSLDCCLRSFVPAHAEMESGV